MSLEDTRIAVVGPTGVVGKEVLGALLDAGVDSENITLLGSERAQGEEVEYGEDSLEVEKASAEALRNMQVVILAAPAEVSRQLALAGQAAGAWVVDCSDAFRSDANVPLVLPPVNGALLDQPFKGRVVRVPSAGGSLLATLLAPLKPFGARSVFATAMLGASHVGARGIDELEKQTADLLSGREPEAHAFPQRIAFNLIPQVGEIVLEGNSGEELRWREEVASLLGESAPALVTTAIQVPTFYGHAVSFSAQLDKPATADALRDAWKNAGLKVLDEPAEKVYPMPMLVTADPSVHVGRIRVASGWVHGFAVIDNAGRGGALNAVEVAERLVSRG